jgi:hypothetical protein
MEMYHDNTAKHAYIFIVVAASTATAQFGQRSGSDRLGTLLGGVIKLVRHILKQVHDRLEVLAVVGARRRCRFAD